MPDEPGLTYDPAARYEVKSFVAEYLSDGSGARTVTIYQPQGSGPFPAMLRVHGGAWNVGDRLDAEMIDSTLAASGMVVATIDIRQAPEHPYPAMVADTNYAV